MSFVQIFVVPPNSLLLLALGGALLWKRRPKTARALVIASLALLWVASMPLCGGALLGSLQVDPPLALGEPPPDADAIVLLSAGTNLYAPEYGGTTVDRLSLERLRYAALLQRATGIPLLVTGGPSREATPTIAELMRDVLVRELGAEVTWVERQSESTWENATMSAPLLSAAGVQRVLLVTSAWHMPRARRSFEAQGFEVIAAPTGFRGEPELTVHALLPGWKGMRDTALGCHEWIGRAWYALRGR